MNNTSKGVLLGFLGVGIAVTAVGAIDALCEEKKVAQQEKEEEDFQFIGEAATSFGRIAGVLVFLLIFLLLAGVALVVYGANKAAKNADNRTFDENARRTNTIIDIGIKGKQLVR